MKHRLFYLFLASLVTLFRPIQAEEATACQYPVTHLQIRYATPHHSQPSLLELKKIQVNLLYENNTFTEAQEGKGKLFTLESLFSFSSPQNFDKKALLTLSNAILHFFHEKGIQGVFVSVDPSEIDSQGNDLRKNQNLDLHLLIKTARIGKIEVHQTKKNNAPYLWIAENSPLKSSENIGQKNEGDLFFKDKLDDYLFYLNRNPSRRVEANISPLLEEEIGLEFLIDETKPWLFWGNIANTGSLNTQTWVESIGYVNNQLFTHDDILRLFYATDGFETLHSVYATYKTPSFWNKSRWGVAGGYNRFKSTEFGVFPLVPFTGEQFPASLEFIYTFYQSKNFFADLHPSIEYRNVRVNNPASIFNSQKLIGKQNFLMPRLELSIEKQQKELQLFFAVAFDWNPKIYLGSNRKKIDFLGRFNTSKYWYFFDCEGLFSFYIDPWLKHASSEKLALVNEFAFRIRSQYVPHHFRLIPQMKAVLGGFNTVRGYPETVVSGDTSYVFTGEYLLHIPRLFPSSSSSLSKIFGHYVKVRPDYYGGATDWDLILRGFVDIGRVFNNKATAYEVNATLMGIGGGLEFLFLHNIIIRADLGFRMKSIPDLNIYQGKNRLHFSGTLVF